MNAENLPTAFFFLKKAVFDQRTTRRAARSENKHCDRAQDTKPAVATQNRTTDTEALERQVEKWIGWGEMAP